MDSLTHSPEGQALAATVHDLPMEGKEAVLRDAVAGLLDTGEVNTVGPVLLQQLQRDSFLHDPTAGEYGDFGPVYRQFAGNASAAIEHLRSIRDGEAIAALNHPEIGSIDLPWGKTSDNPRDTGYGLAKIERWHPEVLDDMQARLQSLPIIERLGNQVVLDDGISRAVISTDYHGLEKTWLLTHYEKRVPGVARAGLEAQGTTHVAATLASGHMGAGTSHSLPHSSAIHNIDPSTVKVDAKAFQFKSNGDDAGLTDRLHGVTQWDQRLAGTSLLWRDRDGQLYVADGHQRHGWDG